MSKRITQCIIVARRRNDDGEKISERGANYEGRINKKCSFGHFGELFSAEEMLRFGRKRECTHKKGRRRDQLVKFKRLYVQSDLIGFVQGLTIPVRHNGAEGT